MSLLILGLFLFLGAHSTRIVADGWRTAMIRRLGAGTWKGLNTLMAVVGLGLVVWGFGLARQQPVELWLAPASLRVATVLLTLIAFILLVAAYVPRNAFKARLHHPMVLGVMFWALAHLLANGNLADVVLFGSFLAWSVLSFGSLRSRDRSNGTIYAAGTTSGTVTSVVVGIALWAGFAFWAHGWLISIRPV